MQLQINNPAPAFTLYNTEKVKISLSDQKGSSVLLLFFPLAFSSVCTTELCSVRDNLKEYEEVNAKVFGISIDSLYTLAKFKELQQLNFPLLSDFNKDVSTAYDSLYDVFAYDMKGVSKRSAFIIDKEGILQYEEILDNPGNQPNFQNIKEKLKSL